jgi:hypothetical protein
MDNIFWLVWLYKKYLFCWNISAKQNKIFWFLFTTTTFGSNYIQPLSTLLTDIRVSIIFCWLRMSSLILSWFFLISVISSRLLLLGRRSSFGV